MVPDSPRTGVDRACRYEPDLNRTYHEMALHYGVALMRAALQTEGQLDSGMEGPN